MKMTFTEIEKQSIQSSLITWGILIGDPSLTSANLNSIEDTGGMFQTDSLRDKVTNAVIYKLEALIGGGQWLNDNYEPLRSAAFKLSAYDINNPLAYLGGHPPTGIVLKQWVMTSGQLTLMQAEGLKAVKAVLNN